jgi:hypothetical protein
MDNKNKLDAQGMNPANFSENEDKIDVIRVEDAMLPARPSRNNKGLTYACA